MITAGAYTVILERRSFCTDAGGVERILAAMHGSDGTVSVRAADPASGVHLSIDVNAADVIAILHHDAPPAQLPRTVMHLRDFMAGRRPAARARGAR
jgi:hypothetical protein